jgi:hypothetical protein
VQDHEVANLRATWNAVRGYDLSQYFVLTDACNRIAVKAGSEARLTEATRRKTMLSKNNLFVSAAIIFFTLLGVSGAKADTPCFTLASLNGTYAVKGHYEGGIAVALGVRRLDEKGNLTGTFILNEPVAGSATGARTIITGTQMGSVTTLNCNGTGVFSRVLTASNGVVVTQMDDFVITQAIAQDGHLHATVIQDAQRTPSALLTPGVLVTREWTRVPEPKEDAGQ